jgi:hypothetical protein
MNALCSCPAKLLSTGAVAEQRHNGLRDLAAFRWYSDAINAIAHNLDRRAGVAGDDGQSMQPGFQVRDSEALARGRQHEHL